MSKIIVVTGSNKGIGRALVERLLTEAPEFDVVIMTSRNMELGYRAKGEIEFKLGKQNRLQLRQLDVTSRQSIDDFVVYLRDTYGHVDVLVNNAGIAFKGNEFGPSVAEPTFACNFYGLVNMTDTLLPLISSSGHIIQVTSISGRTSIIPDIDLEEKILSENFSREEMLDLAADFLQGVKEGDWIARGWPTQAYAISKVLANAYTRIVARELKRENSSLKINAVCPGDVKTDMSPNGRITPEEGAETLLMLAKYQGEETGKFWREGVVLAWS